MKKISLPKLHIRSSRDPLAYEMKPVRDWHIMLALFSALLACVVVGSYSFAQVFSAKEAQQMELGANPNVPKINRDLLMRVTEYYGGPIVDPKVTR